MNFSFGAALFIVLVAFGLAKIHQSTDIAGAKRIIGGDEIDRNTHPWMAAIFQKDGSKYEQYVNGILIDSQWVVSSAVSILYGTQTYEITLGDPDTTVSEKGEQRFRVMDMIYHPNFTTTVPHNFDVVLLKLDRKAILSDKVKPLPLPPANAHDVPSGTLCTVSGWGSVLLKAPKKHRSPVLRIITIPIVNYTECRRVNRPRLFDVDNSSLCAGYKHNRSKISGGRGDAGSPLICKENGKDVFRGVGSWGGINDTYDVFTKVIEIVGWIKTAISSPLPPPLSTCRDNHHFCKQWVKRGECEGYYKKLILKYCPISCKEALGRLPLSAKNVTIAINATLINNATKANNGTTHGPAPSLGDQVIASKTISLI